jgi:hypothetical protein
VHKDAGIFETLGRAEAKVLKESVFRQLCDEVILLLSAFVLMTKVRKRKINPELLNFKLQD